MRRPGAVRVDAWLPHVAHLLTASWLFAPVLVEGRVLFFRDISSFYYPGYVFLSRSLHQGVWPLWNPTSDAGAPCLFAYPVELGLVALLGPRLALAVGPPLHLVLALCGATMLARRRGLGAWGGWAAGVVYGLSGFALSCVNLMPLFHALAWAPWVLCAFLAVVEVPSPRAVALLGVAAALQLTTLAGEIVLQTAVAGLALVPKRPRSPRVVSAVLAALAIACACAAPALLGARALVEGSRRGTGFATRDALSFAASPVRLLEGALPHLAGNVHTFSDAGYWKQAFDPEGFPYLLSLYVGPLSLLLAWRGREPRLLGLVLVGVLLGLGTATPLRILLLPWAKLFRAPIKFLFLTTLGVSLMAGRGLDRSLREADRAGAWTLAPGGLLAAVGLLLTQWPTLAADVFGGWAPSVAGPNARHVAAAVWPSSFSVTGLLALAAALALRAAMPLRPLAGVLLVLDLALVNGALNQSAPSTFYELRPEVAAMVRRVETAEPFRWFSYGVANAVGLGWSPDVVRRDSDTWLYYLDRQSLLARSHVLDGLEAAYDFDRTAFAPVGATLTVEELNPARFAAIHARLRLANVRWLLSFNELPGDQVVQRDEVRFAEVREPLRLYELRDALPRAFWVDGPGLHVAEAQAAEPGPDPPPATARVEYRRRDPHTVELHVTSEPGAVVVLDGYQRDWRGECGGRPASITRVYGRYWAVATPGGTQTCVVRYRPAWWAPSLWLCGLGVVVALVLARRGRT